MKPHLLKMSNNPAHSFSVRRDTVPYINNRWHYHTEIELIYFNKGNGTQFVGDSIKQFQPGDMVLLGTNLPHYWRFDDCYFIESAQNLADVTVTHFNENFWGNAFLLLPENKAIKSLLEKAKNGVQITGPNKEIVAGLLGQMINTEGYERIVLLIKALGIIAASANYEILASYGFSNSYDEKESERINAIYEYSISNFRKKISLNEIAEVARISPNSFCRYFKSLTRKTYSRFLAEIKIGHACKLLIENKLNIKQLCYESGFNNFASFHKQFKQITGKSPLAYQKNFIDRKNHNSFNN